MCSRLITRILPLFLIITNCSAPVKKTVSENDIDEPENNPVVFSTGVQTEETKGCFTEEFGYIPEGTILMAYEAPTVVPPKTCQANTRVCQNGVLSGVGGFLSCLETPRSE